MEELLELHVKIDWFYSQFASYLENIFLQTKLNHFVRLKSIFLIR